MDTDGNVYVAGTSRSYGTVGDFLTIKYTGAGVPLWTNRFDGAANNHDDVRRAAVDASGNVYVTGLSYNGNNYDIATLKYSSDGTPLWTNVFNGSGNGEDQPEGMAVDASGNVYVTGMSWNGNDFDYVTLKYSAAGTQAWARYYQGLEGGGHDEGTAVAVDAAGNVFVTGSSLSENGVYDYATLKYSSTGDQLWVNRYNGPSDGFDTAVAIAVDGNGSVVVTGFSANSYGFNAPYKWDYVTIKYTGDGSQLWLNRYNGPANSDDLPTAMTMDGAGNVYVTGYSSSGSSQDYATVAYSSAGSLLWVNRYDGPAGGDDQPSAIAVDHDNVYVTGTSMGANNDYATVAYTKVGVPMWAKRYNGPANRSEYDYAIAADGKGNVYVTGGSHAPNSYDDYATIKYAFASDATPLLILTTGGNFGFTNNLFGFDISGTANANVVIQSSTNLTDWNPVQTNNLGSGRYHFSSPQRSQPGGFFYRAMQLP